MIIDDLTPTITDNMSDEIPVEQGTATLKTTWQKGLNLFVSSAGTPQMDGTAAKGTANALARSDHIHPTDTSRASQTDMTAAQGDISALQTAAAGKVLYFTSVTCTATTSGNFVNYSNASITANHVLAECVFANPSAITNDVTWTTAAGNIKLNGTCSTATTVNLVLVKKDN